MQYDELDLATEERNAWQRGDSKLAAALARILDLEYLCGDVADRLEKGSITKARAAEMLEMGE